jgi:uroporphyrinogen III methyltransferase/synthase
LTGYGLIKSSSFIIPDLSLVTSCDIYSLMKNDVQIHASKKKRGRPSLVNKRILITRAREQTEEFSTLLKDYGAEVIAFPTIAIAPPGDWRRLDKTIEKLDTYDWVVFTSVNGVRFFTQRLKEKGVDTTVLGGKKLCAIGPRTQKELEKMGLTVLFRPAEYRAEAVAEGLRAQGIQGKKILLPRAREARRLLPDALREAGALVDEVEAYQTVRPVKSRHSLEADLKRGIDVVVFTSPSTVHNFMGVLSDKTALNGVKVAVIGPVTGETARNYGLEPSISPSDYTIPSLVQAIVEYFTQQTPP